jgi:hypothetical protein
LMLSLFSAAFSCFLLFLHFLLSSDISTVFAVFCRFKMFSPAFFCFLLSDAVFFGSSVFCCFLQFFDVICWCFLLYNSSFGLLAIMPCKKTT